MKKIDMAQSFKNLGQKIKNIPQMDKKELALYIAKIVCFALTFPTLFIVTLVNCARIAQGMPFYTFWPYVGAIVAGALGLIFGGVAFWLYTDKQKAKRTIMQRTAILLVICILLTAGMALIFDIGLPDILAKTTFGTLYVEDMFHNSVKESRIIEDYIHLFVGLNILNGNYDGELAYENVKADPTTKINASAIVADRDFQYYVLEKEAKAFDVFEEYWFGEYNKNAAKSDRYTELDVELYEFIYEHYVLMDYDYALNANVNRKAFCLALVDVYSDTYAQLCKEGFKTNGFGALGCTGNEKLTQIFGQNYATQDMDGYMPITEDIGIALATNNRMTTPSVIRMFLNDSYTYTQPIYGEDGKTVVGYDGFMSYQYMPEIAEQYTGEFDENGRGKELFLANDGNYYYAYETGHVDTAYTWCLLDLLGEPMPLAEINIAEMLNMPDISNLINIVLSSQGDNIEDLLNEGLTNRVIATVADGQKLYLNLYVTDEGAIAATLYPLGMKYGYIGYQYMSWLEMGNLLLGTLGVVSMRNYLYIFAAITLVMVITIGFIDSLIEDRKKKLAEMAECCSENGCDCDCDCCCDGNEECVCDCDCDCADEVDAILQEDTTDNAELA